MGTDNPVELSLCQLEVKLNKHCIPLLALRTLPDTYLGAGRGKSLPRELQLPDRTQVQSNPFSRSQAPGDPQSSSGLRGVGPVPYSWETVGAALIHVAPGLGTLRGVICLFCYYLE